MGFPKKAADFIPYCADQGLAYLAGAAKAGVGIQAFTVEMPVGGVINLADVGAGAMASASYAVIVQNQSNAAAPATVSAKGVGSFTLTGPAPADVLDVVVVGALKDQVI